MFGADDLYGGDVGAVPWETMNCQFFQWCLPESWGWGWVEM